MAKSLRAPASELRSGRLLLPADIAHYVVRVHRRTVGDVLCLFDPAQGIEADAELVSIGSHCEVQVGQLRPGSRPGLAGLSLVQALGKGDKPERVIRDATAMGVGRLLFVQSDHSVVRLTKRTPAKVERWRAVALDAARQSLRTDLPTLEPPRTLDEVVELTAEVSSEKARAASICLDPRAGERLGAALRRLGPEQLTLWIGPEGGFSAREVSALEARGTWRAHLGSLVLRTELAAAAALAVAVEHLSYSGTQPQQ